MKKSDVTEYELEQRVRSEYISRDRTRPHRTCALVCLWKLQMHWYAVLARWEAVNRDGNGVGDESSDDSDDDSNDKRIGSTSSL